MGLSYLKSRNDLSVDEIKLLLDNETDLMMYKKLNYLKFRVMGYSAIESMEFANIKRSTAYYIENKWSEGGYNALLPKKRTGHGGRKLKLNEEQIADLGNYLKNGDDWTIMDVKGLIKDKWDINYTYMGVKSLLVSHFDVNIDDFRSYNSIVGSKNISFNRDLVNEDDKNEIKLIADYLSNEKDIFVYRKLVFLLFQKLGYGLDVIESFLGVTSNTLLKWNMQWDNGGYESLLRNSKNKSI